MSLSTNKHSHQFMNDIDMVYEELKSSHAVFINSGKLFFDDRTKLFEICICDGWNEWAILSYNQCRIAHNAVVARILMQVRKRKKDDKEKKEGDKI
jgi:hypothetical protein